MIWYMLLSGLISALILATVHLALRYWLKKDVHVVYRYMMGTLAMDIPLTVLVWAVPMTAQETILAVWVVLVMTGAVVAGLYAAGSWWEKWHQAHEREAQVNLLEGKIK